MLPDRCENSKYIRGSDDSGRILNGETSGEFWKEKIWCNRSSTLYFLSISMRPLQQPGNYGAGALKNTETVLLRRCAEWGNARASGARVLMCKSGGRNGSIIRLTGPAMAGNRAAFPHLTMVFIAVAVGKSRQQASHKTTILRSSEAMCRALVASTNSLNPGHMPAIGPARGNAGHVHLKRGSADKGRTAPENAFTGLRHRLLALRMAPISR